MIAPTLTARELKLPTLKLAPLPDFRKKSWYSTDEVACARNFYAARAWFQAQGVTAPLREDFVLHEGAEVCTNDGAAGSIIAIKFNDERVPIEVVAEVFGRDIAREIGRDYFRPHRRLIWRANGSCEAMPSLFIDFDEYDAAINALRPDALFDGSLSGDALREAWERQFEIEAETEWADWWTQKKLPPVPPKLPQTIATAHQDCAQPHQAQTLSAPDSAGRIAYRRASDIQAKPINWLWPGRIARGKVFMLAGNPGLGKSQITASMAATVSTGGIWPVDRSRCERGNVIFLSAEDDAEDTIRPRLEAAGADLSCVFILDAVVDGYRADGSELQRGFNLKTDLERLGKMLEEIGGAALIVIDPITAYLGETDSHKNAEIRALLAPLGDLAAKHGAAVVCVSHLNKGGSGEALMRVTGSLAFVAAARAAFIVAKDNADPSRRLFLPLKNNIGNDETGLSFMVESVEIRSPAGKVETSRIAWGSESVTVTADEAVASASNPEEHSDMQDAKSFLHDLLSDGPVPSKQIRADTVGAGYSWRTIQRAQKALKIEAVKDGMRGGWTWKLP